MTLKDQLEMLAKEYPLVQHTEAGRTFSATYEGRKTYGHSYIPSHRFCHFDKNWKGSEHHD